MQLTLSLARFVLIFAFAGYLSSFFNSQLTALYIGLFPIEDGGFTSAAVLIYGLEFFFPMLALVLGDTYRYRVVGVFLVIALIFNVVNDSSHILFSSFILASGALIGYVLRFVATKAFGEMSTFQPYKKYF